MSVTSADTLTTIATQQCDGPFRVLLQNKMINKPDIGPNCVFTFSSFGYMDVSVS